MFANEFIIPSISDNQRGVCDEHLCSLSKQQRRRECWRLRKIMDSLESVNSPKIFNPRRTWVFEPQNFDLKTQPWTSKPWFWHPESWILFGASQKRVVSANDGSRICPNLPQFLAVSTRNLHTIVIWWSFIIIWSLYDHHRIIIWSQRLDVIKKKGRRWIFKIYFSPLGFDEASREVENVCFQKQR